jgi:hypothetical protein
MRGKNQDTLKENTTKKYNIEVGKITEEMTNKETGKNIQHFTALTILNC